MSCEGMDLHYYIAVTAVLISMKMKTTKVQTLGTVALHATTDCTDDASIVGLGPLNWAIV